MNLAKGSSGGKNIDIGSLVIAIALRTQALEQGLKSAQQQIQQHSKEVEKSGQGYDKLALAAGYAFYKITTAIKSGTEAYSEAKSSLVGLQSIVNGTGNDFGKAQAFINLFTDDGLIPASQAATALKNLLSRGFGMDQAVEMLNRLKDSAAFGRQASLSMGQAIQGATEGIKNENSVLVKYLPSRTVMAAA